MPLKFLCKGCGHVLYEGSGFKANVEIGSGIRRQTDLIEPSDIYEKHDGKCPKCGRKLPEVSYDIDILPLDNLKIGPTPFIKKKRKRKNKI